TCFAPRWRDHRRRRPGRAAPHAKDAAAERSRDRVTFVVVEGGEGSGKSTQVERLARRMRAPDDDVVTTFQPGHTKVGAEIRDILLHSDVPLDAQTELLLLLADRAQHVAEVIAPALTRGAIVISDRFAPSTIAYQGVARGLGAGVVEKLSRAVSGGV